MNDLLNLAERLEDNAELVAARWSHPVAFNLREAAAALRAMAAQGNKIMKAADEYARAAARATFEASIASAGEKQADELEKEARAALLKLLGGE